MLPKPTTKCPKQQGKMTPKQQAEIPTNPTTKCFKQATRQNDPKPHTKIPTNPTLKCPQNPRQNTPQTRSQNANKPHAKMPPNPTPKCPPNNKPKCPKLHAVKSEYRERQLSRQETAWSKKSHTTRRFIIFFKII